MHLESNANSVEAGIAHDATATGSDNSQCHTKMTESFCDKYRKEIFSEGDSEATDKDSFAGSARDTSDLHVATSASTSSHRDPNNHVVNPLDLENTSDLDSDSKSAGSSDDWSTCECEDLEQCPHARQYVLSTGTATTCSNPHDPQSSSTATCSYHTDTSDASVSYFFEPPLHPRVFELKEDHRLEQDCQVRRVSNAVFVAAPDDVEWSSTLYDEDEDEMRYDMEYNTIEQQNEHNVLDDEVNEGNDDVFRSASPLQNTNTQPASSHTCISTQLDSTGDNANDLEMSPQMTHRNRACALRFGGRTCSFDSTSSSVCADGLSLSDSCCESGEE